VERGLQSTSRSSEGDAPHPDRGSCNSGEVQEAKQRLPARISISMGKQDAISFLPEYYKIAILLQDRS
jgi:hypothetical protein